MENNATLAAGKPNQVTAMPNSYDRRYDWMCAFEIGIAALNHIADSRLVLLNMCGHRPPYEHPEEYTAQVLNLPRRT
jgi:pimeloyl-ACP methyl ester carboxylesterase